MTQDGGPQWFRLDGTLWAATTDWNPQVGDLVCDCSYRHLRIVWIDEANDEIELEDGSHHSLPFCCDPPGHAWPHPEAETP